MINAIEAREKALRAKEGTLPLIKEDLSKNIETCAELGRFTCIFNLVKDFDVYSAEIKEFLINLGYTVKIRYGEHVIFFEISWLERGGWI